MHIVLTKSFILEENLSGFGIGTSINVPLVAYLATRTPRSELQYSGPFDVLGKRTDAIGNPLAVIGQTWESVASEPFYKEGNYVGRLWLFAESPGLSDRGVSGTVARKKWVQYSEIDPFSCSTELALALEIEGDRAYTIRKDPRGKVA